MEQLELPLQCTEESHNWSNWMSVSHYMQISTCNVCNVKKYLVPRGCHEIPPLPVKSSFSVFLADFKARFNK